MVSASTSLPTPVSPRTRTLRLLFARSRTSALTASSVGSTTRNDSEREPLASDSSARRRRTMTNDKGPIWKLSPTATGTGRPASIRAPSTRVPLREPRSSSVGIGPSRRRTWRRDSALWEITTSHSGARPMTISPRNNGNVVSSPSPATSNSPSSCRMPRPSAPAEPVSPRSALTARECTGRRCKMCTASMRADARGNLVVHRGSTSTRVRGLARVLRSAGCATAAARSSSLSRSPFRRSSRRCARVRSHATWRGST